MEKKKLKKLTLKKDVVVQLENEKMMKIAGGNKYTTNPYEFTQNPYDSCDTNCGTATCGCPTIPQICQ